MRGGAGAHPRLGLAALLLAFSVLAGLYSLATPVFEGPDEIWHFAFASHLASGHGLPVLNAADPNLLLRNAAHPPLYYLPVAGLIAPIDRQDFPSQFRFNLASPHITPGSVSERPNLLLHTAHEDWPYRQSVLAVHVGRLVSIALGVLTLWGVWAGARRLLPGERALPLLAVGLVAFVPQFVYGSGLLNNDALAAAAGAWTLVALIELMNTLHMRWAVLAGALLGVGLLSKLGLIVMLPLPAAAMLLVLWPVLPGRPRRMVVSRPDQPVTRLDFAARLRQGALAGLVVYGVAALVAGWWYLRNWRLYGDPLAWREWQALAGVGRTGLTARQFLADMLGLFGTFWADFGLRADRAWVGGFVVLALLAAAGLMLRWRRREWPALHDGGLVLTGLWFGLLLASAVRYAFDITDIHGRLLYPALTAVGVGLALGLTGWGPRLGSWLARGAVGGLLLLSAAVPLALIGPAYARPVVAGGLPPSATAVDVAYGGLVSLAGYKLPLTRLEEGDTPTLVTYWRLDASTGAAVDTHAVLALVQPDGTVVARQEALLGSTVYPSSVWQPGDLIVLESRLAVDPGAVRPSVAEVWVGVRADGDRLLPSPQGDTVRLGHVALPPTQGCVTPANSGQVFGDEIRLVGYAVDPGGVTLCWDALRPPEADYTVFVHILDAEGNPLGSADGPPRDGQYPTTAWQPGDQIEDRHTFNLPSGARLQIGLYRPDDGQRLALAGTEQTALDLVP